VGACPAAVGVRRAALATARVRRLVGPGDLARVCPGPKSPAGIRENNRVVG
jgi:hypothetical protein